MILILEALAGDHILKCGDDAQRVADLLGITAKFEFNGVTCLAFPGGSGSDLVKSFDAELRRRITDKNSRRAAYSRGGI